MKGALPPSSMEQFSTVSLAVASSLRPTAVEPVKDILRTRGSCMMAAQTGPGSWGVITLITPGGTPASSMILATARAVSGVSMAGLRITVQPAPRAGAILRVAMAAGKFHGVISSEMPMG